MKVRVLIGWYAMTPYPLHNISREALERYRNLFEEEFGECLSDEAARESMMNLLRFFEVISKGKSPVKTKTKVTDHEGKALQYIRHCLEQKTNPTVRGIAVAIGRSSSRSGMKMLEQLIVRGMVYRSKDGKIVLCRA